jgi:hypothetical protein
LILTLARRSVKAKWSAKKAAVTEPCVCGLIPGHDLNAAEDQRMIIKGTRKNLNWADHRRVTIAKSPTEWR